MEEKIFSFLCLSCLTVTFLYAADNEIKSISDFLKKFSNVNVEEIMSNDRLFQAYHKCFMDQGPCTPDARDMKNMIPALVKSACESCTVEQKKEMKKHLDYAKYNKEKEWNELLDKYDPKRESLEKFLASIPS